MLTDGFNFPGKFNACHKGSSSQIVIGHDNLFQPPVYLSSATDLSGHQQGDHTPRYLESGKITNLHVPLK